MTKTLVTGGAGFVGKHLVHSLITAGHQVRVLDLAAETLDAQAIELVNGSITNNNDAQTACKDIDIVFHLAGNAQLWAPDPTIFDAINHQGTRIMLNAAQKAGVKQFVHCSSLTTLVGKNTPLGKSNASETTQLTADEMLGPYPVSKARAEAAALESATQGNMDVKIAIPTEPLGAGDDSITPPTQMILDFVNGKTPAYIDCILNFVPVISLANGLLAIAEQGKNGERYLLGGENIDMQSLLQKLQHFTGNPMPKLKMPYGVAWIAGLVDTGVVARLSQKPPKAPLTGVRLAGRQVSFQSEKARTELGWQASGVDHALQEMLTWAKTNNLIS